MMIRLNLLSKITFLFFALLASFATVLVTAQEKAADLKVDVDINKGGDGMSENWMTNPLIWVIGALFLIIIIVLVARGGGKK